MNHWDDDVQLHCQSVSVPLRGKDSHERGPTGSATLGFDAVSVPLRGKDSHELMQVTLTT